MERTELYAKICKRAEAFGYHGDRISLMMDIESADRVFHLQLEELLNADELDFIHDVIGITQNIVRDPFPATNFGFFVPRFAANPSAHQK